MLGVTLLPIYLWGSGGIQISHVVLALSCLVYFLWKGFKADAPEILLLLLTLYIFVRESVAFLDSATDLRVFLPALYMLFNLIIFTTIRRWTSNYCRKKWLSYSVIAAAAVAMIGVLAFGYQITVDEEGGRAVGTFNNPNQLGYFSVCIYSIIVILYYERTLSKNLLFLIIPTSIFLAIVSLSKAAMVSIILSTFLILLIFGQSKKTLLIGNIIGASFVLAIIYYLVMAGYFDQFAFFRRLMDIGSQADDSLEGRGYHVLLQAGVFELLFGFGTTQVKNLIGFEVHSTIGGVFINYGILGVSFFLAFLVIWARRLLKNFGWLGLIIIASPTMLYGLTHNGIRFTIFWVLLGLSFSARRLADASTTTSYLANPFKKRQRGRS